MRTSKRKISAIILLVIIIISASPTAVLAEWGERPSISGKAAYGAALTEHGTPLELKKEKLIFNIPNFPYNKFSTSDVPTEHTASVTAIYELYNPTNAPVNVSLAFPIGRSFGESEWANYSEKYTVTANGEPLELKMRHSFYSSINYADSIKNEKISEGIYSPTTRVTVYIFNLVKMEEGCFAEFTVDDVSESRKLITESWVGVSRKENSTLIRVPLDKPDNNFKLICIGAELPSSSLSAVFYSKDNTDKRPQEPAKIIGYDIMTFDEFAMQDHTAQCGINETDWYNAMVDNIKNSTVPTLEDLLTRQTKLSVWGQYEIGIQAGETVENTVSSPICPTTQGGYEPPEYDYSYYRSDSNNWASVGRLDIEIITPYHIIEKYNTPELQKNENGYSAAINNSNRSNVYFTLSEDPSPKDVFTQGLNAALIGIEVIVLIIILVIAAIFLTPIVFIVITVVKRCRKPR